MANKLCGIVLLVSIVINAHAQTATDNTDVCLKPDNNGSFDQSWCTKLTRIEGCRLGIMNLLFAATAGDTASLRKYKGEGMDMSLADYDARAAIHLAAAEGHLDAVKFLLEEAKVPPAPKDRWGNVPLDEAKRFNRADVVTYLQNFKSK